MIELLESRVKAAAATYACLLVLKDGYVRYHFQILAWNKYFHPKILSLTSTR